MKIATNKENSRSACLTSKRHGGLKRGALWSSWLFPIAGLLSLIWFLVRVLPRPSRATYPCQRIAAPLAGSFVLWAAGVLVSLSAFRKARKLRTQSKLVLACACLAIAVAIAAVSLTVAPERMALADDPSPNAPIGVAKGVNPGRVIWAFDPSATEWKGPGDGHWWENGHTHQAVVDAMMSGALRRLSGTRNDRDCWNALFRYFNNTHGRGDKGYRRGEKIVVKVNLVGCIANPKAGGVDPNSYDLVRNADYMNTSPQMILALLAQLVDAAGVDQSDISVGDPLALFPNQYYDICNQRFPKVHYLDHDGGNPLHPRTPVRLSSIPFYWSSRPAGTTLDYVPDAYAEATYLINMANLKSHTLAGVTLCAKNHFGSLIRTPPQTGYYDMHTTLPGRTPGAGHYRDLVDLMGHAHVGAKTLVFFIDGLYPGVHPVESVPRKWNSAPFNGDWTSSLFASQDPVAIDSVAFDFLRTEWNNYPRMSGADDYLHEAALADNPPSGTFYDPNHDGNVARLASLGVHEHWNNARDRQYSRNLGTGKGIELLKIGPGLDRP
ncbi:MAG TPA: DUF362 domain-containing protein [Acidobacteriota bacterium]|nr:DUF362 domain-containing protein [Acidobacteriota bacterium]